MPNTLHGAYVPTTWVDNNTPLNMTNMNHLEKQNGTALASFNPDLIASGFILSGVVASRHNSYASNVLADSPVGYYRLDEPSGAICQDSSGNGLALTYFNGVSLAGGSQLTGDNDFSAFFTAASSQYAASTFTTGLPTGAAPISLECWIKFAANPASNQFIFDIGDRNTATHHLALLLLTTGAVQLSNGTTSIASAALTTATRHHIVGTYDGTNLRLYVDNVLAAGPTAATNALAYTGNTLVLASQSGATPGAYYNGTLDEAAVYASALSATRVTAHWTAGTTATTQLDVGSGTAYLVQSDATVARCDVVSSTQTTSTINTTYFLDLNPDGSWSWGTSHSVVANHLTIASVATDSLGNTVAVTDLRPLNVSLLPAALGNITSNTLPRAATPPLLNQHVTSTALQQITLFVVAVTGMYQASGAMTINNGTNGNNVDFHLGFTDPNTGQLGGVWFPITNGGGAYTGGVTALNNGTYALPAVSFYAQAGTPVFVKFQDPTNTPNDWFSLAIERLT